MSSQVINSKWTCPSDRELMLRSRLSDGRGWCTRAANMGHRASAGGDITADERSIIESRLNKAQEMERIEANRLKMMVTKLERLRRGSGIAAGANSCDLCGTVFNFITKLQLKECFGCRRRVCKSCGYLAQGQQMSPPYSGLSPTASLESRNSLTPTSSLKRQSIPGRSRTSSLSSDDGDIGGNRQAEVTARKHWICLYCSECQEVWKRSGAWFHGGISPEILALANETTTDISSYSRSRISDTRRSTAAPCLAGNDLARLRAIAEQNGAGLKSGDDDDDDDNDSDDSEDMHFIQARQLAAQRKSRGSGMIDSIPAGFTPRPRTSNLDPSDLSGFESPGGRNRKTAFSTGGEESSSASEVMRRGDRKVQRRGRSPRDPKELPKEETGASLSRGGSPATERRRKASKQQNIFKRASQTQVGGVDSSSEEVEVGESTVDIDALVSEVKTKAKIAKVGGSSRQVEGDENRGEIFFSVIYDSEDSKLTVTIKKCMGLLAMDRNGFSDPYVIVQLLMSGSRWPEEQTSMQARTLDPVFNEHMVFDAMSESDLTAITLRLQVLDYDQFTKHDFIGEVAKKLDAIHPNCIEDYKMPLEPESKELTALGRQFLDSAPYGKIYLGLNFQSSDQTLVVKVLKATGLPAMDMNGLSDPYVKCYLYPDPRKSTKMRTKTIAKTLNPEWNEEFRYPVKRADLRTKTLAITVWDYDWSSRNDFIGGIYLGDGESGSTLKHFIDCVNVPNTMHTVWHTLTAERRLAN